MEEINYLLKLQQIRGGSRKLREVVFQIGNCDMIGNLMLNKFQLAVLQIPASYQYVHVFQNVLCLSVLLKVLLLGLKILPVIVNINGCLAFIRNWHLWISLLNIFEEVEHRKIEICCGK